MTLSPTSFFLLFLIPDSSSCPVRLYLPFIRFSTCLNRHFTSPCPPSPARLPHFTWQTRVRQSITDALLAPHKTGARGSLYLALSELFAGRDTLGGRGGGGRGRRLTGRLRTSQEGEGTRQGWPGTSVFLRRSGSAVPWPSVPDGAEGRTRSPRGPGNNHTGR